MAMVSIQSLWAPRDAEGEIGKQRKGAFNFVDHLLCPQTHDPQNQLRMFQSFKCVSEEKGGRRLGFYQMATTLQWKSVE